MPSGGRLPLCGLAVLLACCPSPRAKGQSVASWQDSNGNWHEGQPPAGGGYRPAPLTPAQIQQQQQAAQQRAEVAQRALQAYLDQEKRVAQDVQRSKDEAQQQSEAKRDEALQALKDDGSSGGFSADLKEADDPAPPPNPTVTGGGTAFGAKDAGRDLFAAAANGNTALGMANGVSAEGASGTNDILESSLESARADASLRFDHLKGDSNAGQFDTVVLAASSAAQAEPVKVPPQVAADPHFKALVLERDALKQQSQQVQKQLDAVKADPSFAKDSALLTKADKLQTAAYSLKVMEEYDTKKMDRMVHLSKVDLDDDAPAPANKSADVPPPAH